MLLKRYMISLAEEGARAALAMQLLRGPCTLQVDVDGRHACLSIRIPGSDAKGREIFRDSYPLLLAEYAPADITALRGGAQNLLEEHIDSYRRGTSAQCRLDGQRLAAEIAYRVAAVAEFVRRPALFPAQLNIVLRDYRGHAWAGNALATSSARELVATAILKLCLPSEPCLRTDGSCPRCGDNKEDVDDDEE